MKKLVGSSPPVFPYLILAGELAVGIGLVIGFLAPISLLVAIFLNLNYITLAGVKPKDISVNAAYQCEQGQNWTMLISEIVLLATVSWSTLSIDSLLGLF